MDSSSKRKLRSGPSPLDLAKASLSIPAAWVLLKLPKIPKHIGPSPFRPDKKASFSISADGKLFHDFATGDSGDIVAFVARALKCSLSDAAREVIRMAASLPPRAHPEPTAKKTLCPPDLTKPTRADLEAILKARRWLIGADGLQFVAAIGLFHICTLKDNGMPRRAWAITDSSRRCIQVRRLDGKPWDWNGAKAWTLGGSQATWPIGAADITPYPIIGLCAGGPDLLAGYILAFQMAFAPKIALVAMPGESAAIADDALPFFAGKRVRIYEHRDQAGAAAGNRWATQLRQAGATVDGYNFDEPHKDLADVLAGLTPEDDFFSCEDLFKGLGLED